MKKENNYLDIIDSLSDGVYRINADGYFSYMNKDLYERLGIPRDQYQTIYFLDLIDPEYHHVAKANFQRVMNGENGIPYELKHTNPNGQVRFVEVHSKPFFEEGKVTGIIGISRDITDRKRVEKALKDREQMLGRIIQASPIPTLVIGNDHKVLYWNEALEMLSGIKAKEVIGTTNQWKAFYKEERPCLADILVDQALDEIPQWYFENCVKSRLIEDAYEATDFFPALGDRGKWLRYTAARIMDFRGEIVGAVEALEDITERKQANDTLEILVQQRTAELSLKNEQLAKEIKERKHVEATLQKSEKELKLNSVKLEELNAALKILLKKKEQDREELEENVLSNVKHLLFPHLEKVKTRKLDPECKAILEIIELNLKKIISPFSQRLSSKYLNFTPMEIKVANLIREGKTTKEIATFMGVSVNAINHHRHHIREKIGLLAKKKNLRSCLASIA
ncbi:MAG: PAS domain S-box protein [Syntrophaceae bacterium]